MKISRAVAVLALAIVVLLAALPASAAPQTGGTGGASNVMGPYCVFSADSGRTTCPSGIEPSTVMGPYCLFDADSGRTTCP